MEALDLQKLLEYYDRQLCCHLFRYVLSNGKIVEVIFYQEQFCHLIGLQYIYDHNKHYLGAVGHERIKCGELTTDSLKAHNKKQYSYIKDRLLHFMELTELLKEGQLLRFYPDRTHPGTKITAEYLLKKEKKTYVLHLFLRKEGMDEKTNRYAPVSFIVKSGNDKNKSQYYDRQEYKTVVCREIIEITETDWI